MESKIGDYLLIIGLILVAVLGLAANQLGNATNWFWMLLVILGMAVGFLNVNLQEAKEFVIIATALVVIAYARNNQISFWNDMGPIGPYLKSTFDSILAFLVPMGIVAGLKLAWTIVKK